MPKQISVEDLHRAADLYAEDRPRPPVEDFGLSFEDLKRFIREADWHEFGIGGPPRRLDPLALAIGISVGVIAANR